jgi:Uma2 family endonuclease
MLDSECCGQPGNGHDMATATELTTEAPPAQDWRDVLVEIAPAQGCWSEEEYLVLTDNRNRLVEYTDGFVEVLPMPTDAHQAILGFLYLAFFHSFGPRGGLVRFSALRLRIRSGKFREPDLMLLLSAQDSRRENRYWLGADLALEVVSEDKPERDLVDKVADYAEGHIPEYWIVNPLTETITVLSLVENAYQQAGMYRRGDRAGSALSPDFSLAVDEVFDAPRKQ